MSNVTCKPVVLFLLSFIAAAGFSQESSPESIRLAINCPYCDMNYLRQELNYVDHVRDQALSDVLIQVNRVQNASGGSAYELRFIGRGAFSGIQQKLTYNAPPTYTPDQIRKGLAGRMKIGLVPYLAQTGLIDHLKVEINGLEAEKTLQAKPAMDPWNYWIFEAYARGHLEKETYDNQFDTEAGFSADRITEDWRIQSRIELNYFQRHFENEEDTFSTVRRRHFLSGKVVRSLGPHWSAGLSGSLRHDTYDNVQHSVGLAPAVEFSFFPYSEVIHREITLSYYLEGRYYDYLAQTIYGKDEELLFLQTFQTNLRFRQPWGDVYTQLEASAYLHDFSKNRLELFSRLNIRVWKGLAVSFSANIDLIRDQLSLPVESASVEDILLRQRQIATNYHLGLGVGLSYTFGSAYNNIVNTRL